MTAKVNAASIPRAQKILGKANCLAGDLVGDCVRITGPKVANRYQVARVDITVPGSPPAVGVIVRKDSPTLCVVQFHGPMVGIYTGLVAGVAYLVGTDGRLAKVGDLTYPSGSVFFQQMAVATSSNELLVSPQDVAFGGPDGSAVRRYREPVLGTKNSVNLIFTVGAKFVHVGYERESVYLNGVLLDEGAGNDYVAEESGGIGTGYDTIHMQFPPRSTDKLVIDYVPAP